MELLKNPFAILGANTRSDRRDLVRLAEDGALSGDPEKCSAARSELGHPRKRLSAELAWLPGLAPRRAEEALAFLRDGKASHLKNFKHFPALARCNIFASVLGSKAFNPKENPTTRISGYIQALCKAFDEIDPDTVLRLVNEDRAVAGFPEVGNTDAILEEIDRRRRFYQSAMQECLDRRPPEEVLEIITSVVSRGTDGGQRHAPVLVDDLVDFYDMKVAPVLKQGAIAIDRLVDEIRQGAKAVEDEDELEWLLDRLEEDVKNWDRLAQPVQISTMARGLGHGPSEELAQEIRALGVELANEHAYYDAARRITSLISEAFAEVLRVAEQAEQDHTALDEIIEERDQVIQQMAESAAEWAESITYSTDVGAIFKKRLSISPEGVEWKGNRMSLSDITGLKWGGTKHYVNGVPTGTTFQIVCGGPSKQIVIDLKDHQVYGSMLERLWRAVGIRLLTEMLEALGEGRVYQFGDARISDEGVTFQVRKIFSADRTIFTPWSRLKMGSAQGCLILMDAEDRKASAQLSYQDLYNVHVLEAAINAIFKSPASRMSALLS